MLLAAVHLDPAFTIPPALLLACIIVWYWRRIGRSAGHASRRRIRRISLVLMLVTLPVLVLGLSYFDSAAQPPIAWTTAWCVALLLMLCILVTAIIDGLNNFRLGEIDKREQIIQSYVDQAKKQQRAGGADSRAAGEQTE